MANNTPISQYLINIMNAVYGRDVRSSIHDAIEKCYDDVSTSKTIAEDSVRGLADLVETTNLAKTAAQQAAIDANDYIDDYAKPATKDANDAASLANEKASLANEKAGLADEKASLANEKAGLANEKAGLANEKAGLAERRAEEARQAAETANNTMSSITTSYATLSQQCTEATGAATRAAGDANTAAGNATTAAGEATAAAGVANPAASRANTAAQLIEKMTVTSEDAPPSAAASATITEVGSGTNKHKNIHFVLKQGEQGAPFLIKGPAYASLSALQNAVTNPSVGDQYNVGTAVPYDIYRWTGTSWENQGKIGSNSVQITNAEIDYIRNGQSVDPTNKFLGVTGLGYLLNTILQALLDAKVDTEDGMGLSTNDFTDAYKDSVDGLLASVASLSNTKVDKVSGKGLSTNDFTTALKNKLDGIAAGATNVTVDTVLSDSSTNAVQNKVIKTALANKVDKVSGKGLSTNDFTTALKNKLDGIAAGATKVTVDSALSDTSTNPVQNSVVTAAINNAGGSLKFTSKQVASWTSNALNEDYPYRASISCNGVTSTMVPSVIFSVEDAVSGNFAPVSQISDDNIVYIWAKETPQDTIEIPTIIVFK